MADQNESLDAEKRKQERLDRLQKLRLRQNEARKLNHKEVVEESRKKKLPANWEKQRERLDHEEEKEQERKRIEAEGLPYDRVKNLDYTAEECELWERKRLRKFNPDTGFVNL